MDKKINKYIIIKPEEYQRLQQNQFPQNLSNVEKSFLDILTNKSMSKASRLAAINHLILSRWNVENREAINRDLVEENVESDNMSHKYAQTSFRDQAINPFDHTFENSEIFKPKIVSSPKNKSIEARTTNISRKIDDIRPSTSHFYPDSIFNRVPERRNNDESVDSNKSLDLSDARRSFIKNLEFASDKKNLDLRRLSVKNLDDKDESFVHVRDDLSNSQYLVQKPKEFLKRKRRNDDSVRKTPKKLRQNKSQYKPFASAWKDFQSIMLNK